MVRTRIVSIVMLVALLAPWAVPCVTGAPIGRAAMPCCHSSQPAAPVARPCCVPDGGVPSTVPPSTGVWVSQAAAATIVAGAPVSVRSPQHLDARPDARVLVPPRLLFGVLLI
jgi:hypothetical protein